jgi:hypothetical protein
MFNISNFFKKKSAEQAGAEEVALGPVVEKQVQIDRLAIHAMPERFRHQPAGLNRAKAIGWLIIGGGAAFLILVSAFLYFYLFKKQPIVKVRLEEPVTADSQPSQSVEVESQIEQTPTEMAAITATATPSGEAVLPVENGLATSTATTTQETVEQEEGGAVGLIPSLDSDSDGLSDAEEILLGTATSTPDTDGDGYFDGAELENLYDPATSTTRLIASPKIALYENKTFNYSVLYPRVWRMSVNGGDDSIMFRSDDNQFFQIITQTNTDKQSLDQWYLEQLGVSAINDTARVSGSNWRGIRNLDGLTLYLMDAQQKHIFTLAYNPGENNILDYIHFFNAMAKSFALLNNEQ